MPKPARRLGQDRPTPDSISGVRAPARLPDTEHNLSLDEVLARAGEAEGTQSHREDGTLQSIALELIDTSPYQPRLKIAEQALEELANSIQSSGLLHPILVRPKNGRYELIGGERRWRAHQLLKAPSILAYVRDMDDANAEIGALADNEGHASLSDYERGKRFHAILTRGIEPSQRALARRISVNVSTVSRCLAFMQLPAEVLAILEQSPELIGVKKVADFVALAERHADLVSQAVLKMQAENLSQEAALRWIQQQINALKGRPDTLAAQKKALPGLGQLQISGNKIQLQCESNIDSNRLADLLEDFLSNLPPEHYQKS